MRRPFLQYRVQSPDSVRTVASSCLVFSTDIVPTPEAWLNPQNKSYGVVDSRERRTLCVSPPYSIGVITEANNLIISMHEFNQSLRYDKRMYVADIIGSIAYSKALTKVGILTKDEEDRMVKGLQKVRQEWDDGVVSAQSTRSVLIRSSR